MLLEVAFESAVHPHATDLVRCPKCRGTGNRSYEERFGRRSDIVSCVCRECGGTGKVLRGDPLSSPASLTLDYRVNRAA